MRTILETAQKRINARDIGNEKTRFHARCPQFWDICNGGHRDSPGQEVQLPTLSVHRRNIRFPAVDADVQLAGKVVQCE